MCPVFRVAKRMGPDGLKSEPYMHERSNDERLFSISCVVHFTLVSNKLNLHTKSLYRCAV